MRHYLPRVPTILVGLKTDIRDDDSIPKPVDFDPVKKEEGEELGKKIGASVYMEACAKTRAGIDDVFTKAISTCWDLTDDAPDTPSGSGSTAEGGDKPAMRKKTTKKVTCTLL